MKKILLFRHESWIEAPHLTNLLSYIGIPYQIIKIDEANAIPKHIAEDIGGLVFLGGTMSVNDKFSWIEDELDLIRQAHECKLPVLGHCLGSQLISKALGGKVLPMVKKEIGWHPISFMDNKVAAHWQGKIPNHTEVMLWHGEEFTMPEGASPLYTTANCKNQAFVKDNIMATVAHIEVSSPVLDEWLDIYGYDIELNYDTKLDDGSVQTIQQIKDNMETKMLKMHVLSDIFYIKWLKLVFSSSNYPKMYHKLEDYLKFGSCLCEAVYFFLKHPRDVVNCHCAQCRKFHGNYAAFTKVKNENIYINDKEKIHWYQKHAQQAKRGFCKKCGSSLFWQLGGNDEICVSAGALDAPTNLKTTKNIYVNYQSDFYNLDHSLENFSATMYKDKRDK